MFMIIQLTDLKNCNYVCGCLIEFLKCQQSLPGYCFLDGCYSVKSL